MKIKHQKKLGAEHEILFTISGKENAFLSLQSINFFIDLINDNEKKVNCKAIASLCTPFEIILLVKPNLDKMVDIKDFITWVNNTFTESYYEKHINKLAAEGITLLGSD